MASFFDGDGWSNKCRYCKKTPVSYGISQNVESSATAGHESMMYAIQHIARCSGLLCNLSKGEAQGSELTGTDRVFMKMTATVSGPGMEKIPCKEKRLHGAGRCLCNGGRSSHTNTRRAQFRVKERAQDRQIVHFKLKGSSAHILLAHWEVVHPQVVG
jgi:hypothetical protein